MDSPGTPTPCSVTRTFSERKHARQYTKLSMSATQIHLLCRRAAGQPAPGRRRRRCEGGRGGCDTAFPAAARRRIAEGAGIEFGFLRRQHRVHHLRALQRSLGSLRRASVMISTSSAGTSGTRPAMGLTSSRRIAVSVVMAESPGRPSFRSAFRTSPRQRRKCRCARPVSCPAPAPATCTPPCPEWSLPR